MFHFNSIFNRTIAENIGNKESFLFFEYYELVIAVEAWSNISQCHIIPYSLMQSSPRIWKSLNYMSTVVYIFLDDQYIFIKFHLFIKGLKCTDPNNKQMLLTWWEFVN